MTAARRAATAATLALVLPVLVPVRLFDPASAASNATTLGPPYAVVFLVVPTTFEGFMRVPAFRQLARAGGAGLMATDENYRSVPGDVYESLGTGAPPGVEPGLLPRTLLHAGVQPCLVAPAARPGAPVRRVFGPLAGHRCFRPGDALVQSLPPLFTVVDLTGWTIERAGVEIRSNMVRASLSWPRTRVMVLSPYPSDAMNGAGDEVTPIAMASGPPGSLFPVNGPFHTLTSNTTRQAGLVANVDVAPTVLSFFGISQPVSMDGSPITVTGDGAPFALHRKHLDQRRIRVPIQLFELGLVVAVAIVAGAALIVVRRRGRILARAAATARFLTLMAVAMMIPIAAAGVLPRLTYAVVVPYLVVTSVALAALSLAWLRGSPLAPFTLLGVAGLGAIILDLAFGGRGLRVPLLGGTMFDGVRLYGLPNAFEATVLASALFVAFRLGPLPGGLLVFGCGLVAGLPHLGADLGGSLTMFLAAGLWWQLRSRGRLRLPQLAVTLGVTVAGLAVVVLAGRYLAGGAPTHVTHFVQQGGGRLSTALAEVRHRLGVGAGQVIHAPAGLIALLGLPAALWLALAGPTPIGEGLAVEPGWRDVVVILTLAGMAGYFVNDTGLAAAAPTLLYAGAALAYPALCSRATPSVQVGSSVS